MQGLGDVSVEVSWRRYPISSAADRNTASVYFLPISNETYPPWSSEFAEQDLREVVEIGDERRLEDNADVWCVEQFDWEGVGHSSVLLVHQRQLHLETLQVDHQAEDEDRREEIR